MKSCWQSLLLSAGLTGLLLFSCFPLLSFWPLSFVTLIPLYFHIRSLPVSRTFLASWISGAFFYLLLMHWIVFNPAVEGWVRPLLYLGVVLIAAYLSLYFALALALAKWLSQKNKLPFWLWAAITLPLLDYLRTSGLLGFPWGSLGYALVPWTPSIQTAEYTGVYGLSLWVFLLNGLAFLLIEKSHQAGRDNAGVRRWLKSIRRPLLTMLLVLALPPLWGSWRIKRVEREISGSPALVTSVIQGNIQQGLRWDREFQQFNFESYRRLTNEVSRQKPELVIWPETAIPFYLRYRPEYFIELASLSRRSGAMIMTGVPDVRLLPTGGELYFNSAFLFDPARGFTGSYDKSHLVPFGERFPLKDRIPLLRNVNFGEGEWTPGVDTAVFQTERGAISCLICFESIFPEISRKQVQKGSRLLVNITNDGWFGRSGAARQHADMAVLRAVEQRRSLARCANSGVSMFVLPTGAVIAPTRLFVQATILGRLPLLSGRTFYGRHGDLLLILLAVLLAGGTGWILLGKK
jgi:apolipoprotein N-acyltransferase